MKKLQIKVTEKRLEDESPKHVANCSCGGCSGCGGGGCGARGCGSNKVIAASRASGSFAIV